MKFDEEDLLDLINGPLNSPSQKDQNDSQSNKNDDLLQNDREPDIISVSTRQWFESYNMIHTEDLNDFRK